MAAAMAILLSTTAPPAKPPATPIGFVAPAALGSEARGRARVRDGRTGERVVRARAASRGGRQRRVREGDHLRLPAAAVPRWGVLSHGVAARGGAGRGGAGLGWAGQHEWARLRRICAGTGPTPSTSTSATVVGLTPATSARGLGATHAGIVCACHRLLAACRFWLGQAVQLCTRSPKSLT
jgi:hypothetical protein